MSEAPTLRIVPGAPPPTPLTKSQRKKRRAANAQKGDEHDVESPVASGHGLNSALDSALVETATSDLTPSLVSKPEDVTDTAIASEAAADILSPTSLLNLPLKKTSAIVELVNKRHRTLHKKIQRIKEYSSKPAESLNEDQKRTLATLPQLEASSREVEEVRKAIEVHEAEEAANDSRRLAEIEAIVKQRIADAVSESRNTITARTVQLVMVMRELPRLHSVTSSEEESSLVAEVTAALESGGQSQVETTVGLFLTGKGNYSKLVALVEAAQHPPSRTATPAAEPEVAEEPHAEESAIKGAPSTSNMTGSYHFMQESELEPPTPFDEGAEWVDHPEAAAVLHHAPKGEPAGTNPGRVESHIDWAAEDHEDALPSISGLQEQFGTSGQATPITEAPDTAFPTETSGGWGDAADATKQPKQEESDGFTTIPNKRGGPGGDWRGGDRARGRGGYRGRSNGGGDWRAGSGSGNWGSRENREGSGGEGSGRGGYRGGGDRGRGEFRGRARGEWRGRGGERGRGEGRGGFRGRSQPVDAAQ